MPALRIPASGRVMSDFSFIVRCPYCGGRFAPEDGSCCEPPEDEDEEGEEESGGVGPDDGLEESRAIHGAQRPLHEQSPRSLPAHPRLRSSGAHSSPGGLGYTAKYYPRPTLLRLHPNLTIAPCAHHTPCRKHQLLLLHPSGTEECMYYPGALRASPTPPTTGDIGAKGVI